LGKQHLAVSSISEFHIKQNSIDKLLKILKQAGHQLPSTARSLMKTCREVETSVKSGMQYLYLDLVKKLQSFCNHLSSEQKQSLEILDISLNIDGLPLFKSSNVCLWPILCGVMNFQPVSVFAIALSSGHSKPSNLDFLNDVVRDLNGVMKNGLKVDGKVIKVNLSSIVCDAPARAMVKATKLYSGYAGCDKCCQRGTWVGRMTYPEVVTELRTDSSFRNKSQKEHHHGVSPFCELPIDMVKSFPLD
jgi:hypothetical protein